MVSSEIYIKNLLNFFHTVFNFMTHTLYHGASMLAVKGRSTQHVELLGAMVETASWTRSSGERLPKRSRLLHFLLSLAATQSLASFASTVAAELVAVIQEL